MSSSILVYVDNIPVYIPAGATVLQACEKVGVIIPRFCYHDLLEIAGNCRMCLVEVERSPKPQVACGLPVLDQIRVYTNTPLVKKAREGVLEFLLLNHPLDCPICDQGGECDLQNQAIKYGNTINRFYKLKRGVEDKGLGPLIKTVITRCIHCTRCIRFAWDVAGVEALGTSLRGNQTEVGTYVEKSFNSEVSANIIDLCPVGALTSKVHAFKTRPWELKTTISIDLSDSLGSHITIESKRSKPVKITPRPCMSLNLEWLSDKARYTYEGYTSIRLAFPYFIKNKKAYQFSSAIQVKKSLYKFLISQLHIKIICGRNLDLETIYQSQFLCKHIGVDILSETPFNIIPSIPAYFQSTLSLDGIKRMDSCLMLGVNPRIEATIANLHLRTRFKAGLFNVFTLGNSIDLTYKSASIGLQLTHLYKLVIGKHNYCLHKTRHPLFVYGDSLSKREDSFSSLILSYTYQKVKQSKNWYGCLRLPLGSNSVGKAYLGVSKPVLKIYKKNINTTNYLLGIEETLTLKNQNHMTIFETTHVNSNFNNCKFILPLQSAYEKNGSFINFKGLIQKNSSILRFGSAPLSDLSNFTENSRFIIASKNFDASKVLFNSYASGELAEINQKFKKVKVYTTPLKALLADIYRTDNCTCASLTLAKVSANYRKIHWNFSKQQIN